ncbi:MAG: 3-isopropylmalate dehydrogenase [Candidatus Dadabacteria bacterium]|nr:3-isopropylmalate dehydrogenase [Candidatus Dadabacteria bacterium]MDE0519205.1 3-isopropylmalate dehydrogenase [Candidatus Dadabacteria bacterium]MDE0663252.1 3-isopropylmalate dehydrogenase [Candidatus Dadabacteria bacterium]
MPKVLVIPGDGIGTEVTEVSLSVLKAISEKNQIEFTLDTALLGGCCIDAHGVPVTEETIENARQSDAVLLGAVGGPKWENIEHHLKPERGLLELRKRLDAFANLRPAVVYSALADASTLKREVVQGVDIMVVRELTGGIYFGHPRGTEKTDGGETRAFNTLTYSTSEIKRVARTAFEIARKRKSKVTSIDKSNVLESMVLWRDTVTELGDFEFPDVTLEHLYVDNAAMQLIRRPADFDVILAGNMFGDIISDEAAQLTGSLGMLPSASVGKKGAIYEPVHGSAPDIAGKGVANPIASILSMAMMLRYSFDMDTAASSIEKAVEAVLNKGYRTSDIYEEGKTRVGTGEMGSLILDEL